VSTPKTQLVVLGGGPGGYTAAFRAADLGLQVTLVEREPQLGGVCLNIGCIPSKALLHAAKIMTDAEHAERLGITYASPQIDLDQLRASTTKTIGRLTDGLGKLATARGVNVVHGVGSFTSPNTLDIDGDPLAFDHAILATGSQSTPLPGIPYGDSRVMTSTEALALPDIPKKLLVVGGGIIGLELATVYDALGSQVTVVEVAEQLIPEADPDLVALLARRLNQRYDAIHLRTRLETLSATADGLFATFARSTAGEDGSLAPSLFDRALIAIGRTPNTGTLALDAAGIETESTGHIHIDSQLRTTSSNIFAIGDLTPGPMLAHKASHQAKLVAEILAGRNPSFDVRAIPAVAYTEPEIAWTGITETAAKEQGIKHRTVRFPWTASGRAQTTNTTGLSKLILHTPDNRVIGAGIVGANAGELIASPTLAIELSANAQDIALTVHPHPTLSETVALAAEVAEGTITDLPLARRLTSDTKR
jgi:dihydrolipoamide dehydrogenase